MLNSTPLGEVLNEWQLRRHRHIFLEGFGSARSSVGTGVEGIAMTFFSWACPENS
jgi:hypothetical protein